MYICQYCFNEKKNSNSLRNHERLCKFNPNRQSTPFMDGKQIGHIGTNQFIKAAAEGRTIIVSDKTRQKLADASTGVSRKHTEYTKNLMSIKACSRLQKNSKYSKNIDYNGCILESSYELRLAQILDELNIHWEKVRQGYVWNDAGKTRRYIPDFYLKEYDLFLDPKNDYLIEKDKIKIESAIKLNSIKVLVLSNKQIEINYIRKILLG